MSMEWRQISRKPQEMVKTIERHRPKKKRKPLKILLSLAFFIRSQGIFAKRLPDKKVIIEIIFSEEEKMLGIPIFFLLQYSMRQVGENKQK